MTRASIGSGSSGGAGKPGRAVLVTAVLASLAIITGLIALETRPRAQHGDATTAATAAAAAGPAADAPASAMQPGTRAWSRAEIVAESLRRRRAWAQAGQARPEEARVAGLTEAERLRRGITPLALYTSRQSGKWMLLAMDARARGHHALADDAEAMARAGWRAMRPGEETDPAERLSREWELLSRFWQLGDDALAERLHELDASLTAMMQGHEPSVAHKLEVAEQGAPAERASRDDRAEDEDKAALRGEDPVDGVP